MYHVHTTSSCSSQPVRTWSLRCFPYLGKPASCALHYALCIEPIYYFGLPRRPWVGSRGSLRNDHCRPLGRLLISPDNLPTPVLGGLAFGRPLSPVAVSHHLQHLGGLVIGRLHKPLWGGGISVADEISIVGGAQVVYYLHIRRVVTAVVARRYQLCLVHIDSEKGVFGSSPCSSRPTSREHSG
jgi:hypothetical protein